MPAVRPLINQHHDMEPYPRLMRDIPARLPQTLAWVTERLDAHSRAVHAASQARSEALKLERDADTVQADAFVDLERVPDVVQLRDEAAQARSRADQHTDVANQITQEIAAAILRGRSATKGGV